MAPLGLEMTYVYSPTKVSMGGWVLLDLVGTGEFFVILEKRCNFVVHFTKRCLTMNCIYISFDVITPVVRNWGYLENWKSTASSHGF